MSTASMTVIGQSSSGGAAGVVTLVVILATILVFLIGMGKMYSKAGYPGWGAIVPIYNVYVLCKIAGRPGWWLLLYCIPLVSLIVAIIVTVDIARNFGKGAGFALGLIFLGIIFFPVLGYGKAQYLAELNGVDVEPEFVPDAPTPPTTPRRPI